MMVLSIEIVCFLVLLALPGRSSEGDILGEASSWQPKRPRIAPERSQAGSTESAQHTADTELRRLLRRSANPKLAKVSRHAVRIQGTAHPKPEGSMAQGKEKEVQRLVRRSANPKPAKVPRHAVGTQGTTHPKPEGFLAQGKEKEVQTLVRRSANPKLAKVPRHAVQIQGTVHPKLEGSLAQGKHTEVQRLVRRSKSPKLAKIPRHAVQIQGTMHPKPEGSMAEGKHTEVQRLLRRSTNPKLAKVPWQETSIQGAAHPKLVQINRSAPVSMAQDNDTTFHSLMRSTKRRKAVPATNTLSWPMQIFTDGHMSVLAEKGPPADFKTSSPDGIGKQTFVVDQSGTASPEWELSTTVAQGDLIALGTTNFSKGSSGASLVFPVSRTDSASKASVSNATFVQVTIVVLVIIVILLLLQLSAQHRRRDALKTEGCPADSELLRASQSPKRSPKCQTPTQQIPRDVLDELRSSYRSRRKLSMISSVPTVSNAQNAPSECSPPVSEDAEERRSSYRSRRKLPMFSSALTVSNAQNTPSAISPSVSEDAGSPSSQRAGRPRPIADDSARSKPFIETRSRGRSVGTIARNRLGFFDGRVGTAMMPTGTSRGVQIRDEDITTTLDHA